MNDNISAKRGICWLCFDVGTGSGTVLEVEDGGGCFVWERRDS